MNCNFISNSVSFLHILQIRFIPSNADDHFEKCLCFLDLHIRDLCLHTQVILFSSSIDMMVVGDDSGNLRLYNVRDLTNRKSESSDDILKPSRVCFKICLTSSIFIGGFLLY